MEYRIDPTTHHSFSFAHAPHSLEPIVLARLTLDSHHEMSAEAEAVRRVYAAALLAGCDGLDRAAFLDRLGKLGATIALESAQGMLTISVQAEERALPGTLTLLRRLLEAPTFAPEELTRIKRTLSGELADYKEAARARAHDALKNLLFATTDRRATPDLDELDRALAQVSTHDLKTLHAQVRDSFVHASVVGSDAAAQKIHATLARLNRTSAGTRSSGGAHVPTTPKQHVSCVSIPSRTNIEFSIGGPLPLTLHHPDFLPFVFGLNVLAKWGGFAGRLMQRVREAQGLTYMIYGRTETVRGSETGYWRIATFFSPADRSAGLAATATEICTIARDGITADEYERFQTIHRTQQALIADSPERTLADLHSFHCEDLDANEIQSLRSRFLNVSHEDVNAALARYLDPATTYIGAAGALADVENELNATYGRGILTQ